MPQQQKQPLPVGYPLVTGTLPAPADVVLTLRVRAICPSHQTGTLANGVKAAALDASGPNTCVAAFVGGGSSVETEETAGASKLLEYMAFSATHNRCGGAAAAVATCIAGSTYEVLCSRMWVPHAAAEDVVKYKHDAAFWLTCCV